MPVGTLQRLGTNEEASLSDYEGEWVLVNLWASWVEPSRTEAPAIERYWREHRGELTAVGIDSQDATADAQLFAREFDLTYDLLHDVKGATSRDWGATGLPETMLIDPDGNLALRKIGPVTESYLEENVTPLVSGAG